MLQLKPNDQQLIIEQLQKENQITIFMIVILSYITFIAIIFWFENLKEKKAYQKRFNDLIDQNKLKKIRENKSIGFSDEIVDCILEHLANFEKSIGYIQPHITMQYLAEKFNTNTTYLSKVVNVYKKNSFSNYINDLRVDFVVEKLINDKKFRNYSIKAIANEVGYKKAESFSKAFYKKTGMYPSFFIKQLNKKGG